MNFFINLNSYQKYSFILQNIHVIIASIGIVGNMLTFSIFRRKPLRNQTYSFYYRILSFCDTLILTHALRHWSRTILKKDVDLLGPLFCRFSEFQPYAAGTMSIWLRVLILFDLTVRVKYPNHFWVMKRKWLQLTAISIIAVFSSSIHLILPINTRLEIVEISNISTLICYLPPETLGLNLKLCLFNLTLCFTISSFLKFKLISYIYSSRKRILNKIFYKNKHSAIVKDRKFTISSIGVSITFFLCGILFSIAILTAICLQLDPHQMHAVFTGFLTFTICSHSSLFFVNMFMNSIFYNEFRALFGLKKLRTYTF